MKSLREWQNELHKVALEHGWWDEERSIPEMLCLLHSEISEALEHYRSEKPVISENFAIELADIFIRLADMCGGLNIDLETFVEKKNEINKLRPYKHGRKF